MDSSLNVLYLLNWLTIGERSEGLQKVSFWFLWAKSWKRFENKAPISFSKFFSFYFAFLQQNKRILLWNLSRIKLGKRSKEFFFEILFTQLKHILPSLFDSVFFKFRGIRTTQNRILIFVFLFHLPGLECAHRSDSLLGNELASHSEDCELESFPKHHGSGQKTIPDWFHTPSGSDSWMPGHVWAWCWAKKRKNIQKGTCSLRDLWKKVKITFKFTDI